jgi:DNA-binding GntR family transcriptional regulator
MKSALRAIETTALGDRIYEAIRLAIIQNELKSGERISDRSLAERLDVSRTPVREALHQLEGIGLVVPGERSGWVVVPFTERDVRELFELRRMMEPRGLDALAANPDDAVVEELASFFDDYREQSPHSQYSTYLDRDRAFHTRLVECSGNRMMQLMYDNISCHIDRGRYFLSAPRAQRVDETVKEHLEVCQAIAARDFAAARAFLVSHLRLGEELMVDFLQTLD